MSAEIEEGKVSQGRQTRGLSWIPVRSRLDPSPCDRERRYLRNRDVESMSRIDVKGTLGIAARKFIKEKRPPGDGFLWCCQATESERRRYPTKPRPTKPRSNVAHVEGSGTPMTGGTNWRP